MSNTGKSYGKKIVFAVITLALLCYLALAANVVAPINERETALAAATDGIVHGAVSSQTTSGTAIANSTDFYNNIINGAQNGTYYLTSDFTLDGSHMFGHKSTFSGTLYGNGHTITVLSGYNAARKTEKNGILFSQVSGTVRDLTVVLGNGSTAQRIDIGDGNTGYYGVITGALAGGTISNCRVVIQSNVVFHAATQSSGTQNVGIGGIAGEVWNSASKILNCTVENYGAIDCTTYSGNYTTYNGRSGYAGHIAGIFWLSGSDTATLQNIIVRGNGRIHANGVGVVGCGSNGGYNDLDITNYLNDFSGSYEYNGAGAAWASDAIFFYSSGSNRTIYNYYSTSGATSTSWSYSTDAAESGRLTLSSGYNIYFDATSDVNNAVAFVYNGSYDVITKKLYFQPANSSTKYYPAYRDGNTEVFKGLPSATSTYSATLGTFAFDTVEPPVGKLNKWESGYCTTPVETGAVANNGEELERMIAQNVSEIYLADDITDFVGFNTATYSGTIYGNGHTVYIVDGNANTTQTVGGLTGTLTGTVKDLRVVLYVSYERTASSNKLATGIIAGSLNGGTVDNVYVYIPDGVTFGVKGSQEGYVGAVAGVADGTSYTIKNTTVDIDGKMHLDGTYVYMAGFVGKSATGSSAATATYTNNILKGDGSYSSNTSNGTEPIYLAATTVLFQAGTGNQQSTMNIDGFINAFKGGTTNLKGGYSMYGVLTKNDNGKTMIKWTNNVSNVYDYDSPWADINNKGTDATGNNYIDVSEKRATVSTTVESSTVRVTPYFPAGDTDNLVLVAGNGTETVPKLEYGEYESKEDGNYKVVTIPKTAITAKSTVTLTEVITPATPIDDLNQWEHGYVSGTGSTGTAVAKGSELVKAINAGGDIYLTGDIRDFVGFSHTKTYSGTLDGNGHTIYIVKARAASGNNIGGLVSTLSGTIKNVRIVVMAGVDLPSTGYVGAVAGALSGDAQVNNVSVIINSGVSLISTKSGDNVGGAGGIAGGLISGAGTVAISNSTVELNGELNATAKWTFIGGFVGHLNGGNINFTNVIFKGTGALNGTAKGGEGVHTAAVAVVGGGVKAVTLDGLINAFTGDKTSNKSAYAITFVRNGSNVATPTISHVYTYGGNFSNEGSMDFGTPVDVSKIKAEIKTVVDGETVPVIPYFPVSAGTGNLVLVAGDGQTVAGILMYGNIVSTADVANGKYSVITIAKDDVSPKATVILTRPKVAAPTLTDDSKSLVYNGAGQTVTVNELTAGDGKITLKEDQYTLTFAAVSEGALLDRDGKPLNAGTYTLTVTLKGYFFVSGGNTYDLEVTVGQLSVNVEINEQSKLYGEDDPVLTFTVTGSLAQGDDREDLEVTLTREEGYTVGSYAITGGSASVNYAVNFTNGGEALFTIDPRPVIVTPLSGQGHIYGESDTGDLEYEVSGGAGTTGSALIGSDVLSGKLGREEGSDARNYAINLGTLTSENNSNYGITLASTPVYYVISPRPLKYSVTLSGMQSNEDGYFIYYGDFKNSMVTISPVTGDGYYAVVAGETVTVSAKFEKDGNDIAEVKDVGAYSVIGITAVFDAASGAKESNYTVTFAEEAAFSVLPGQVTVNIDDKTKTYGDAAPAFTFTLSEGSELAYGEEKDVLGVTLELKDGDGVNFGEYTITGNWNNNPNYDVTFVDGKLTVNKREITVTLKQNFSSVYGEQIVAPDISALTLAGGSLAPKLPAHANFTEADFSVTFNDNIKNAATYRGYISAKCENDNYEVTWTEGRYTADYIVTPRPVKYVITVQNMREGNYLYYGEFDKSANVKVSGPVTTEAGLYDVARGDSITVTPFYTYTSPSGTQTLADISAEVKNVGTYTVSGAITYGTDTLESNYDVTVTVTPSQSFRIDKRHVTITIGNYTKVYGDKDPVFDWSISDGETVYGEVAHDVIDYSLSRDQGENKGTYEIRAVMISSVNYDVAVVEGTLTVEPKPVTVTITSATKTYGEADPEFKWEHTELANYEGTSVLGFTVTRAPGNDVGEYALGGTATNANYDVTVEEGSTLTINKLAVSFAVTNAQLPYNAYTADNLPEPAGLGADAKVSGTLPYGDKANVVFDYNEKAATIVAQIAGDYFYIDTTVSFVKEDGSDANGNYTYSPITVILKVVSSRLNVDLSGYASEYYFDPASGIILSLDKVIVKTQSGNIISAEELEELEAKITSADGSTAYFTPDENGNIVISYVPSVSKSDKYVSLKFIVTASEKGYDDSTGEKIFTLNKANYDLTGIEFEDLTETYNGEAHEIAYTGTLPAGLTASVSYDGDNVNYSGRDVTATLTFDLTGQEAGGTVYYSYNLPESRTAKLTIKRASVVITVYPQTAVYDKTVPVPSAEEGKDYIITEGEIFGSDDLGITLAITDADYAVGDYDLILSINNTNYILSANSSTFSIEKRVVYVKLTDEYFFKTYGDADPDWNNAVSAVTVYPSGAETGMGLAGDDAVTAINIESVSREAGENAAEYTVTVNCGESNYDVRSDLLSRFIIAPREITVILDKPAFVSVYGEALISPSADTHLKLKAGFALVGDESGKKLSEAGFKVEFDGELAEGNVTGGYYPAKTYADAVMATCSNGNYSVIFEGGSVADYTVTKRPVWITVTPVTVEYGDSGELAFKLSEIQPEKGGLARDEAADDIGITLTREGGDRPDVGKYNIDCIVEENSNYEVSVMNSPEVVYEVTAREIKIIINDAEKTYGDETPVFTWEMAEGYTMAYKEDVSVLGVALALEEGNGVNAGTYTISGTSSALGNYVVIFENATFTVHKKQAVIDVGGVKVEYVYTGSSFRITEGASHNNTDVESSTAQLKYPDMDFLNVSDGGEYKITIGETQNFLAAEATITVTIEKATIVFDWSGVNGEYVYNGSEQTVTGVTINISDGTKIIYSNNTFTDVPAEGVLEVTVTVAENDNILEASETRKVTVSRATIDMSGVSFDSAEYIFDATEKALTVSGTLPWGIEGVSYAGNALTEVGTTEAVAKFIYNDNNFNTVENMTATLTITPRPVTIEITSASKVYGDEDPAYDFALAAEQPYEGTDTVISLRPLDISIVRNEGENVGEYKLTATGNDACYILEIAEEGVFTIVPREIVFAVSGTFASEYDGKAKEVNVNEALTVASGSLAPAHADIAASGAVSVSFAEGVSITNAGLYENAVIFTLIGGNYAVAFEGTTDNVVTADYTVTRRELTVKLLDQRLLKEESIDQNAYEITAGALVKGDTLGITILKGNELGVDRYELISEYANLNYDITFETGTLVYAVRAVITAAEPEDFLYTGEPFSLDVTINSTASLVFYVNGEYSANSFVEPGHYVVTISAAADDTYREPLNVTVIFNILAPEIKHEADGAEISVSTDTGFYPEDSFDIIREQGRENSTIAEMISGEYTIVDGYVLNVSTEGGTVSLGDYLKNNYAGEEHVVRIKVPEQYASDETVECVIIRGGEASMETLDVKDGYIEITAADVEAVAFIAERETLMAVIIIAAVMSALLLAAIGYFIFRNKAY